MQHLERTAISAKDRVEHLAQPDLASGQIDVAACAFVDLAKANMLPPDLVSLAEREHRVAQILVGHALQFGHRAVHQGKEDVVGRNQVAIQVVFGDGLPPSEGLHLATMLDAGLHLLQTVAAEQQLAGKAFNVGVRKAFQK